MEPLIKVTALSKNFDEINVLKKIDLSIFKGEVVVIIGPSGSGKSTLLRCLIGLNSITSGTIKIENEIFDKKQPISRKTKQRMGFVFQHFNLFPNLNVLENITLSPLENKLITLNEANDTAKSLLEKVNLIDKINSSIKSLSGGEQQRVAIARALALNPEIMLFDEPTSALDPETVKDILEIIKSLTTTGMTLVIVTHEMSFAKEVADKVLFMDDGKILEADTPDNLFNHPRNERTRNFLNKIIYM